MLMRRPLCLALLATLAAAGCSSTTREHHEADAAPATRGAVVDSKTAPAPAKSRDEEKREAASNSPVELQMREPPSPKKVPAPVQGR